MNTGRRMKRMRSGRSIIRCLSLPAVLLGVEDFICGFFCFGEEGTRMINASDCRLAERNLSAPRLLARLESSPGDQEKLKPLNEVELRKAAAVKKCALIMALMLHSEHRQFMETGHPTREIGRSGQTRYVHFPSYLLLKTETQ